MDEGTILPPVAAEVVVDIDVVMSDANPTVSSESAATPAATAAEPAAPAEPSAEANERAPEGKERACDENEESSLKCVLWLQKYAPMTLQDTVGNIDAIDNLSHYIQDPGSLPSLILSGPPGCGKTTSVKCLAHHLLGEHMSKAVLEINASDERGIDTIREKVQIHCMSKVSLPEGRYKIIILDEMDSLTSAAQKSLRVLMEEYTKTTRFALACNHPSNIIDAILSRCSVVRFNPIADVDMASRFVDICNKENIPYDPLGIDALVFLGEGDLRKGVTLLQSVCDAHKHVTRSAVFKESDVPNPEIMQQFVMHCRAGEWEGALAKLLHLDKIGYSTRDIIVSMTRVVKSIDIDEGVRHDYLEMIGKTHYRMMEASTQSFLQLDALLTEMCSYETRDPELVDPDALLTLGGA
eukprot:GEMP01019673.1.p1 GENE.GEMP01019673.1~~GEMP01019673.1.p1  ORF type:complete len:410 (-),score=96.66 GEMP01019673.1:1278-2507(-)